MKNCFLLLLVFYALGFNAQNAGDSLLTVLKTAKEDTNKVKTLAILSDELWRKGDDKAVDYINQALQLAQKLNYKKGVAESYNSIGIICDDKGDYEPALENYFKALKINEELNDKKGLSSTYNNIGIIYKNQGRHEKALENYLKSLKIREEIKDKKGVGVSFNNIAGIYSSQKNYPKALEFFQKSLKIKEELSDKKGLATSYNNIGTIYQSMDSLDKALSNFKKSVAYSEEILYKRGIANANNNIGIIYKKQGDLLQDKKAASEKYDNALTCYLKSLQLRTEAGNKEGIAMSYVNLGSLYLIKENLKEAFFYINGCLKIYTEIGNKEGLENTYLLLADYYEKKGDFKQAFSYQRLYSDIKDTLLNKENSENMAHMSAQFDSEKKDNEIKLLNKDKEKQELLTAEEKQKQTIILSSVIGGLLIVIVFSVFLYNRVKITQKQKSIIEKQKQEVEKQNELTNEQKQIIELKQKEIIDSINYAKRIQNALLKEQDHVNEHLPQHFILFQPKDIISGDFYWTLEKQGYLYLAAADCTGHGVPGAMMSMLGIAFLNEINSTQELLSPAGILNKLRERIIKELNQSGKDGENKDGMDISLVRLDLTTNKMEWAGANNSIYYIVDSDELIEIKANKQPIAFSQNMLPFTNHSIQLEEDTRFFLYTDGYADQFGGTRGKKFKYAQLKGLLISTSHLSMLEQKEALTSTLNNWKGNLEQVDDILVMGMKI